MSADDVEDILAGLRSAGGRVTGPRRAVVTALASAKGHVTAEQLIAMVRARQPDVADSTVYRNLDELERSGVVVHVHLGHGPASYHLARAPHAHLVCSSCDTVIEVPTADLAGLATDLDSSHGFVPEFAHFAIVGRCRRCRERSCTPEDAEHQAR